MRIIVASRALDLLDDCYSDNFVRSRWPSSDDDLIAIVVPLACVGRTCEIRELRLACI